MAKNGVFNVRDAIFAVALRAAEVIGCGPRMVLGAAQNRRAKPSRSGVVDLT